MKKKYSVLVLALLLALSLCLPASAAYEYGVIYDATEELGSQSLTDQGEETLPQLTQSLGLDLRVDVLCDSDYDTATDAAKSIYSYYDYGYGDEKEGLSLTIMMESQSDGSYALSSDKGWCVYVILDESRGSQDALSNMVFEAVNPYMAERDWNGEDMTASAAALSRAVDAMAEAVSDYFANYTADGASESTDADTQESSDSSMTCLYDVSGLLTNDEWQKLEERAEDISRRHQCGVYAALVDDYTQYGDGDVFEVTYQLYHSAANNFGMGDGRDGILVLLSMKERDYAMFVYGDKAEYAFDAYGQEQLEAAFLSDFGNNDWYGGLSDYLDACDAFLTKADAGEPVRGDSSQSYGSSGIPWQVVGGITVIACLIALLICLVLKRKMRSVRQKAEADAYITGSGLQLTDQSDIYTGTTERRRRIEKKSSGGGSIGRSGGGGSGRSGKF